MSTSRRGSHFARTHLYCRYPASNTGRQRQLYSQKGNSHIANTVETGCEPGVSQMGSTPASWALGDPRAIRKIAPNRDAGQ